MKLKDIFKPAYIYFLIISVLWTFALPEMISYLIYDGTVIIWDGFYLVFYPLILALATIFFQNYTSINHFLKKTMILYLCFNTFFLVIGVIYTSPTNVDLNNRTYKDVYDAWDTSFFEYEFYMNHYMKVLNEEGLTIEFGDYESIRDTKKLNKFISFVKENRVLNEKQISNQIKKIIESGYIKEEIFNKYYGELSFDDKFVLINNENFKIRSINCNVVNLLIKDMIERKSINNNKFYEILYVNSVDRYNCIDKDILDKNYKVIAKNKNIFWYKKLKELNPYFDGLLR